MKLNQPYNREDFFTFLDEFLPSFEKDIRKVSKGSLLEVKEVYSLGNSEELEDLAVFEIAHKSVSTKRVGLANDAFKLMKNSAVYKALVVFYSEDSDTWRLSLMTMKPEINEKGKVANTYSNPRRYSFALGPEAKINTPHKFLKDKGPVSTFEELSGRFSVEVVNKEFYQQISLLYTKLLGGERKRGSKTESFPGLLKLPSVSQHSETSQRFAVRLIGRIIFCWFLREKKSEKGSSLIPSELLSLKAFQDTPDYYHSVLEPIFFEILNRPLERRKEKYQSEIFQKIPYLNGGLFSPDSEDYYSYDEGKQAINHNIVKVPDEWLQELFEVLDLYNFTVDENTSVDVDLSIDPEMLGRIFENLLAEINPETGESARKNTGSYYTPREIVEYMVDQSLTEYLKTQTNIDREKLESLVSYNSIEDHSKKFNKEEREKTVIALSNLKTLDPACGSGAFPIGLLQKIVFILQCVDPKAELWFEQKIEGIQDTILKKFIKEQYESESLDYIRKLGVIRDSIFGVDIQPIATEISRLRCFLTLVVEDSVEDNKPNRGIFPLPNLDFKFVTANSLISLPDSDQNSVFDDKEGIDRLKELRAQYFNASNSERERIKLEFSEAQNDMLRRMIDIGTSAGLTSALSTWKPFKEDLTQWFDPEWMFGIKNGFDIVIANPPYVDSETMIKDQPDLRDLYSENYPTAKGNWDLYIPFLELGSQLISQNGVSCYITPNKWYSIGYGKEIRKKLIKYISKIGNCSEIKVFEAGNSPVVTIFRNNNNLDYISVDKFKSDFSIEESVKIETTYLKENLGFALASHLRLTNKIRSQEKVVGDYYIAENPCSVSEAYEVKKILKDSSNNLDAGSDYFRFVNTGTIDPYVSLWGLKNTTYLKTKYDKPIITRSDFKELFPRRYEQLNREKIIVSGMRHFESFIDSRGEYIAGKSTEILIQKNNLSLRFILGVLNSKLMKFYIKESFSALGIGGGINFTTDLIESLPLPELKNSTHTAPIEKLVDRIVKMNDKKPNADITEEMKEVEALVYELYELTPEEIKIVESSS